MLQVIKTSLTYVLNSFKIYCNSMLWSAKRHQELAKMRRLIEPNNRDISINKQKKSEIKKLIKSES